MSAPPLRVLVGIALSLALLAPASGRAADGWLDEAKLGILDHDLPIGVTQIETGIDVNGEVLFISPSFLAAIGSPRPHLGVTANTDDKTSYAYTGLTWTADLLNQIITPLDSVFGALGLGGAIHDYSNDGSPDRLGLGTRLLFHEEVDLGYRLTPWDVSLFVDHISNADLGRHNPGMTNLGIRTGFLF